MPFLSIPSFDRFVLVSGKGLVNHAVTGFLWRLLILCMASSVARLFATASNEFVFTLTFLYSHSSTAASSGILRSVARRPVVQTSFVQNGPAAGVGSQGPGAHAILFVEGRPVPAL